MTPIEKARELIEEFHRDVEDEQIFTHHAEAGDCALCLALAELRKVAAQ